MGSFSLWHWIIVLGVVALLFGGTGKISGMMGDFAKGIKAFKSGMKEEEVDAGAETRPLAPPAMPIAPAEQPVHDRG